MIFHIYTIFHQFISLVDTIMEYYVNIIGSLSYFLRKLLNFVLFIIFLMTFTSSSTSYTFYEFLNYLGTSFVDFLFAVQDLLGTSSLVLYLLFQGVPGTLLFDILMSGFLVSHFLCQLYFRVFLVLWFLICKMWCSFFHVFVLFYTDLWILFYHISFRLSVFSFLDHHDISFLWHVNLSAALLRIVAFLVLI